MPLFSRSGGRRPGGLALSSSVQRKHKPDYLLLLISLALVGIGMIVVYSISPGLSATTHVSEQYYISKQAIALMLGLIAFGICSFLPIQVFRRIRMSLIAVAAFSALAVQIFGQQVNGAERWIQVGGFSFQSVELIKFALIFYVADLLAERARQGELDNWHKTLKPLLIILGLVGAVVAVMQSDLGSAGVIVASIVALGFSAGIPLKRIGFIAGLVAVGVVLAIGTSSYRRDRLATFLHPSQNCQSTGYQSCQALIAIGSGGIFGLGLGKGVQAYGYLPEAANDSIFAILAEKFGFIGVTLIMALYLALTTRLMRIIERTADNFNRLVLSGILVWISTQVIINVGSMIGLLPLKGITLPLVSYGGTSLIFVMAALGVAFQLSKFTAYGPVDSQKKPERAGYENSALRRGDRRPYYATFGRR